MIGIDNVIKCIAEKCHKIAPRVNIIKAVLREPIVVAQGELCMKILSRGLQSYICWKHLKLTVPLWMRKISNSKAPSQGGSIRKQRTH